MKHKILLSLTNLVLAIPSERRTIAVAQLDPVPIKEVYKTETENRINTTMCIYKSMHKSHDNIEDRPGFSWGLLLNIPVKAKAFSMNLEEPRRLVLRYTQLLWLLHHPPPLNQPLS